nr:unnamed protein product [Callosobruchus analis]
MKDICFVKLTVENYPNCIGGIDGKYVRIIKPNHSGSIYYNYKHYFSLILTAICDSDYKFTFIDIGSYGRLAHSTVFENSEFYKRLQAKITSTGPPNVFVADEIFGLQENIMRPYSERQLTEQKRIFNYRLSRARRYIECTFGILSNKWRIFHQPLNVSIEFSITIVKACCTLHNFERERDGYRPEDCLTVTGFEYSQPSNIQQGGSILNTIRDEFADYFIREQGKLDWQWKMI